jgi:hypothetical protein
VRTRTRTVSPTARARPLRSALLGGSTLPIAKSRPGVRASLRSEETKFYRLWSFMAPVEVDGVPAPDPDAYMTCLQLRHGERGFSIAAPAYARQQIAIENAFGVQTIDVGRPTNLCLRSLREF